MNLNTEGVLVLASSKALKDEYAGKEFDYSFPDGLQKLLNESSIIALTTSNSDALELEFRINQEFPNEEFDCEINQFMTFEKEDELLILSHASFSMICAQKKGDYTNYEWSIEKLKNIEKGTYKVNFCIENIYDLEDKKYLSHYKVIVSLMKVAEVRWKNRVTDLSIE